MWRAVLQCDYAPSMVERKHKGAGRPQSYATIKDLQAMSPSDNQTQT
jgi:hypothetical protein